MTKYWSANCDFHWCRTYLLSVLSGLYLKLCGYALQLLQELDYNLLCEMNFLDMCVQESLRIFPPAVRYDVYLSLFYTWAGIKLLFKLNSLIKGSMIKKFCTLCVQWQNVTDGKSNLYYNQLLAFTIQGHFWLSIFILLTYIYICIL